MPEKMHNSCDKENLKVLSYSDKMKEVVMGILNGAWCKNSPEYETKVSSLHTIG